MSFGGSDAAASQQVSFANRWRIHFPFIETTGSSVRSGLQVLRGELPANIPTGVGGSGTIYFSSDIENAIYKIAKK